MPNGIPERCRPVQPTLWRPRALTSPLNIRFRRATLAEIGSR
jgi:hypothetical protein